MHKILRVLLISILGAAILCSCSRGSVSNKNANTNSKAVNGITKDSDTKDKKSVDKEVINDLSGWSHPVKQIFEDNRMGLQKVEMLDQKTYHVFYVEYPFDLEYYCAYYFKTVIDQLARANGYWNFELRDTARDTTIKVLCDKNKMTVSEIVVNGRKGYFNELLKKNDTLSREQSISSGYAVKVENIVISNSQYDINNDGKKEDIEIALKNGKFDEDKGLWSGNGPKWVGDFIIRIVSGEKILSEQSLNELMNQGSDDPLSFWAPKFKLHLKDYNSDNKIDFNLGQYFSTNGNTYMLFTINEDGRISVLPIQDQGELFVSARGRENSTDAIYSDGRIIRVRFYDNREGEHFRATYNWDNKKKAFVLLKKEAVKP